MTLLPALPNRWRDEADTLEHHGCEREADQLRQRAREVEQAWEKFWNAELTLGQAAQESGYAETTLREMVGDGRIPDLRPAGSQGRIRIRRRDLPVKPPRPARGRSPERAVVEAGDTDPAVEELARTAIL